MHTPSLNPPRRPTKLPLSILSDEYELQKKYSIHINAFHPNKIMKNLDSSPSYKSSSSSTLISKFLTPRGSGVEETDHPMIITPKYKQESLYKLTCPGSIKSSARSSPTNEFRRAGITFPSQNDRKETNLSTLSRRSSETNFAVEGKVIESFKYKSNIIKSPPPSSSSSRVANTTQIISSSSSKNKIRVQVRTATGGKRKKILLTSNSSVASLQKQKASLEQENQKKKQLIASIALSPRFGQVPLIIPNSTRASFRQLSSFDGFENPEISRTSSLTRSKIMLIPSTIGLNSLTEPNEDNNRSFSKRLETRNGEKSAEIKTYSNLLKNISKTMAVCPNETLRNLNFLDSHTISLKTSYCSLSKSKRGEQFPSRCFEG